VNIVQDKTIVNGALLLVDGKSIFFDFSDDSKFLDNPQKNFDYYFKDLLELRTIVKIFSFEF
jgi:hypothetical protein